MLMKKFKGLMAVLALAVSMALQAQTNQMVVNVKKIGAEIQPTMYGLFFEDINYAADGGLYAELVKNRSFEFPQNLMGWKTFGSVKLMDDGPFDKNPHYVRLSAPKHAAKRTGLENEGFFGIGVKQGGCIEKPSSTGYFQHGSRGEVGRKSVPILCQIDNTAKGIGSVCPHHVDAECQWR